MDCPANKKPKKIIANIGLGIKVLRVITTPLFIFGIKAGKKLMLLKIRMILKEK